MDDQYWETKALLLRILEPRRFDGLAGMRSSPYVAHHSTATNSGQSCVVVGVEPTLENRSALHVAVHRIIKEQGS